eukprot:361326-Chlamydomonas_euryale.AAC.4
MCSHNRPLGWRPQLNPILRGRVRGAYGFPESYFGRRRSLRTLSVCAGSAPFARHACWCAEGALAATRTSMGGTHALRSHATGKPKRGFSSAQRLLLVLAGCLILLTVSLR